MKGFSKRAKGILLREFNEEHSVLSNNLRALAIHGALTVLALGIVITGSIVFNLIIFAFALLAVPLVYMFLAYRLLTPLPKGNLLSVSFLPIALISLYIVGFMHYLATGVVNDDVWMFMWFLNPAFTFTALGVYAYVTAEAVRSNTLIVFTLSSIAACVPSLLMYMGLRIKMWQQGKRKLNWRN